MTERSYKINYIIATYNGKCKRNFSYPNPNNVLKEHINLINKFHDNKNDIQITIMKAHCKEPYYLDYYSYLDSHVNSKHDDVNKIPIVIHECANYGYSMGQWLKALEMYTDNKKEKEFDYFFLMEDDYCPNVDNFDSLLIKCYNEKFNNPVNNNTGLLTSVMEGEVNFTDESYPIHWEGSVLINKNTVNKLFEKWENPRLKLNNINKNYSKLLRGLRNFYIGAYYQICFSILFTEANIEHKNYLDKYDFFYWSDEDNSKGGEIHIFLEDGSKHKNLNYNNDFVKIENSPIIPIQLSNKNYIDHYYNDLIL